MANTTKQIARLRGRNPKTVAEVIARAELLGCEVSAPSKHYRVSFEGKLLATLSATPSDPRTVLNFVSCLRGAGVDLRAMTVRS